MECNWACYIYQSGYHSVLQDSSPRIPQAMEPLLRLLGAEVHTPGTCQ